MLRRGLVVCVLFLFSFVAGGCATASTGGFALYLLRDQTTGGQALKTPLETMALGERVLSSADIVSYTRTTHVIDLTPEAYARVQALFKIPVQVAGMPFVVCVGSERIYAGAFWTPVSSLSFDGPYILQPMAPGGHTVRIDLGYPGATSALHDPRSDPRIMEALDRAGKLKAPTALQQLRIRNGGAVPIKNLTVVFPSDWVAFGAVAAGATTAYREVPHGVYAYSAYEYASGEKLILQPVVDWIGEKPMEGEAFTYTINLDPARAPAPQIRLESVERNR